MLVTIDESQVSIGKLQKRLDAIGDELGVKITIQQEDIFRFMHRI